MTYSTKQINLKLISPKFLIRVAVALILTLLLAGQILAGPETILKIVDTSGNDVGRYNSVAINYRGNAVISYYDDDDGDLKLAVCNDAACSAPTITTIDNSVFGVGLDTSVVINSSGYPVISYADLWNLDLKLAVCLNVTCTQFTTHIVDGSGGVDAGLYNSLVLDSSDHPIIVYHESNNYSCCINKLRLAVCYDTTCSSPDITPLDDSGTVGYGTSMALNSSGNPVIAYTSQNNLKLIVCQNTICTSRGVNTVAALTNSSLKFSLALNSNDFPIISHYGSYFDKNSMLTSGVKLAFCSDTTCTSPPTFTGVDDPPTSYIDTSMVLNSNGYPVISYNGYRDVRQAVCHDVNCLNATISVVDSSNVSGFSFISMAIDNSDNTAISYQAGGNTLKLAICPICTASTRTTVDDNGNVGRHTSVALNSSGYPVISYRDNTSFNLKLAICDNFDCSAPTLTTVDNTGNVGNHSSLALNSSDHAVISYRDFTNQSLKLAVCNNATTCTNPTLTTVDNTDNVGRHTSLALNSSGYPVISYRDDTNGALKLAVCHDATCTTSPTITTVDNTADVGVHTSLVLNNSGYPVISYYDLDNDDLKLAVCNNANCTIPTLTAIDGSDNVGEFASMGLNSSGYPVISYFDNTNGDLKLAICHNATCTNPVPTLTTVDSDGDVGRHISMKLSSNNLALISYYDTTNGDLKLAVCNDPACTDPTITIVDSEEDVGQFTAIVLDSRDFPLISYYDVTNEDLRLISYPIVYSFVYLPIVLE